MAKEGITYETLRATLADDTVASLYLLHGEEEFLVEEALHAIVDAALPGEAREFNLDAVRGSEIDVRDVVARASAFPMMAERRVVVLREAEKITGKDAEILSAYIEKPCPSTTLVLTSAKADFRKRPFTLLRKSATLVECRKLWENQVPSWIAGRARSMGRDLDPEAVKLLCAYVSTSLREVQNELEKLFIFAGTRDRITADDVAAVVGISKEFSVFELQKAVGQRDLQRAATITLRMIEAGESLPFMLVMLTNYFHALWKLRELRRPGIAESDQAAGAKIPPFALREYADALRRYAPEEVEHAFELLSAADEQTKLSADPAGVMMTLLPQLVGEHAST